MARKARTAKDAAGQSEAQRRAARLDLIRRRHRELILQPRALIAADLDADLDDPMEELSEELEMAQMVESGRV